MVCNKGLLVFMPRVMSLSARTGSLRLQISCDCNGLSYVFGKVNVIAHNRSIVVALFSDQYNIMIVMKKQDLSQGQDSSPDSALPIT